MSTKQQSQISQTAEEFNLGALNEETNQPEYSDYSDDSYEDDENYERGINLLSKHKGPNQQPTLSAEH